MTRNDPQMTSDITPLLPGQPAPDLIAPLVEGGEFRLHDRTPRAFLMVVVYRGHHCGLCKAALEAWNSHADALAEMGVEAVFVSADDRKRAQASRDEWDIDRLTLAWGWDIEQARRWGLYVSDAIRDGEPSRFLEPGLFILDADFNLWGLSIQSSQFARPHAADVVSALEYIIEKDYPPRGAVAWAEEPQQADSNPGETAGG